VRLAFAIRRLTRWTVADKRLNLQSSQHNEAEHQQNLETTHRDGPTRESVERETRHGTFYFNSQPENLNEGLSQFLTSTTPMLLEANHRNQVRNRTQLMRSALLDSFDHAPAAWACLNQPPNSTSGPIFREACRDSRPLPCRTGQSRRRPFWLREAKNLWR
jgi:hypothetical protein